MNSSIFTNKISLKEIHDNQFWLNTDDRRNIWHFFYFVAKNLHGFLDNFSVVANLNEDISFNPFIIQTPAETNSKSTLRKILEALDRLEEQFEREKKLSPSESKEIIDLLHVLMAWLPYMNERHYSFSRYEYQNYEREVWCSFEDMKQLDRTIAHRITPVIRNFSQCSQFPADYFLRMYGHPKSGNPVTWNCECHEWRKALSTMADSWEWLANREYDQLLNDKWESIPDEVYYGLHLFAEYLPEMQND